MLPVLRSLIGITTTQLNQERTQRYNGGNSTVALFLTDTIPLAGNERIQVINEANWLLTFVPGKSFIFNYYI